MLAIPDKDRFRSKVGPPDAAGCTPWLGRRYRDGYGEFRVGRKSVAAHRAAVWIATGASVPRGLFVCHKCDNPSCVNVDHLFVGTQSDNERDKLSKGRARSPFRPGARWRARLTDAQIVELRFLARDGTRIADLAAKFGVTQGIVYTAIRGKTFPHLPVPPQPKRRPSKNSPRSPDGSIRCSKCSAWQRPEFFAPSIVKRGSGWCRACYAAWDRLR